MFTTNLWSQGWVCSARTGCPRQLSVFWIFEKSAVRQGEKRSDLPAQARDTQSKCFLKCKMSYKHYLLLSNCPRDDDPVSVAMKEKVEIQRERSVGKAAGCRQDGAKPAFGRNPSRSAAMWPRQPLDFVKEGAVDECPEVKTP